MKFALHFGNNTFSDPEGARRLVRLAEAAGFDSVFAIEHVVFPDNYTTVYPYAPGGRLPGGPSTKLPDPLIWLTWVAAAPGREIGPNRRRWPLGSGRPPRRPPGRRLLPVDRCPGRHHGAARCRV